MDCARPLFPDTPKHYLKVASDFFLFRKVCVEAGLSPPFTTNTYNFDQKILVVVCEIGILA